MFLKLIFWAFGNEQRQLSKMRTPSYVKSVTITKLDLGKLPPFATAVHMLPADEE
jgi:Ca2+-dependent lipid-binding protein